MFVIDHGTSPCDQDAALKPLSQLRAHQHFEHEKWQTWPEKYSEVEDSLVEKVVASIRNHNESQQMICWKNQRQFSVYKCLQYEYDQGYNLWQLF